MNRMKRWKCVTIEPLKEEWMQKIRQKCIVDLYYIDRSDLNLEKDLWSNIEILICRDRDLHIEFLNKLTIVKMIFIVSAGVEKIPFEYLKERGIMVANAGGISDNAMSDYAIGAMLLFSSKFKECIEYKSQKYWKPYLITDSLKDRTLLIVGTGKIGKSVAKKAKVFDMNIVGIKRTKGQVEHFNRIEILDNLNHVLPCADYVVCTVPLTEYTYHLFDKSRFEKMKQTAVFINVSRGKIVDEAALEKIMHDRKIRGAVLDVFEVEPLPKSSLLWSLDNVIVTPHSSGRIEEFLMHAVDIFIENFNQFTLGKKMANEINLNCRY